MELETGETAIRLKLRTADEGTRDHRIKVALGVIIFAIGMVIGWLDQRGVAYDDAAITFRYALRIASGEGFNYNPGDATNGASAPLYTLLLALSTWFGSSPESAATIGAAFALGLVSVLSWAIAFRLTSSWVSAVAPVILWSMTFFREQALSGMESGFASALGLAAVFLLMTKKYFLAGLVGGLTLFNKIDSVFLVLPMLAVVFFFHRKQFLRCGAGVVLAFSPWLLFSWAYFGSPLPFSASQKLQNVTGLETETRDPGASFDAAWLAEHVGRELNVTLLVLALVGIAAFATPLPSRIRESQINPGALILALWLVFHFVAFSLVDLGAPYPWYTTVIWPPLAIFVACGLQAILRLVRGVLGQHSDVTVAGISLFAIAVLLLQVTPGLTQLVTVFADGRKISDYERFESLRLKAGIFLGSNVKPGEVIETCFGWIAYGAPFNPIRETCPLATRKPVAAPTWSVDSVFPGRLPREYSPPDGWRVAWRAASNSAGEGEVVVLRKTGVGY